MINFIKFIKSFFAPSMYVNFVHKYEPGDIVEWVDYSWEGKDWLVRIIDYYLDHNGNVFYDVERLSDGQEYGDIKENEFILYATATEMLEVENMMIFDEED